MTKIAPPTVQPRQPQVPTTRDSAVNDARVPVQEARGQPPAGASLVGLAPDSMTRPKEASLQTHVTDAGAAARQAPRNEASQGLDPAVRAKIEGAVMNERVPSDLSTSGAQPAERLGLSLRHLSELPKGTLIDSRDLGSWLGVERDLADGNVKDSPALRERIARRQRVIDHVMGDRTELKTLGKLAEVQRALVEKQPALGVLNANAEQAVREYLGGVRSSAGGRQASSDVVLPEPGFHHLEALSVGIDWSSVDVETMVFIVMMESTREASKDLKAVMASIRENNAKRGQMREYITKMKAEQEEMTHALRGEYDARVALPASDPRRIDPAQLSFAQYSGDQTLVMLDPLTQPGDIVPSEVPNWQVSPNHQLYLPPDVRTADQRLAEQLGLDAGSMAALRGAFAALPADIKAKVGGDFELWLMTPQGEGGVGLLATPNGSQIEEVSKWLAKQTTQGTSPTSSAFAEALAGATAILPTGAALVGGITVVMGAQAPNPIEADMITLRDKHKLPEAEAWIVSRLFNAVPAAARSANGLSHIDAFVTKFSNPEWSVSRSMYDFMNGVAGNTAFPDGIHINFGGFAGIQIIEATIHGGADEFSKQFGAEGAQSYAFLAACRDWVEWKGTGGQATNASHDLQVNWGHSEALQILRNKAAPLEADFVSNTRLSFSLSPEVRAFAAKHGLSPQEAKAAYSLFQSLGGSKANFGGTADGFISLLMQQTGKNAQGAVREVLTDVSWAVAKNAESHGTTPGLGNRIATDLAYALTSSNVSGKTVLIDWQVYLRDAKPPFANTERVLNDSQLQALSDRRDENRATDPSYVAQRAAFADTINARAKEIVVGPMGIPGQPSGIVNAKLKRFDPSSIIANTVATTIKQDAAAWNRAASAEAAELLRNIAAGVRTTPPPKVYEGLNQMRLAQVATYIEGWENKKDSLGDIAEEQQVKLQMFMERYTKANTTLSNLMKKLSDAAQTITQNLK